MANDPQTLTRLLGKPDFIPEKRMLRRAEELVIPHLRKRKKGGQFFPVTPDDLTTLLEDHVSELDLYEDLSRFGPGVEGLTLFSLDRKPIVQIAPELSEAADKHRLKSTLAHELGHVILHNPMFQAKNQSGLFDSSVTGCQVSYRDGEAAESQSDFYELQAWFFCRALLMPASEVNRIIQDLRYASNSYSDIWLGSELGNEAVHLSSTHFGVSPALARIHLLKIGALVKEAPAPSLF